MPVQCVVEDKLYFHNLRFCIRSWVTLCLSRYVYGVRSQRLSFPPPLPPFGVPFAGGRGNQMHKFMLHHTTTLHLLVILLSLVTFSHNVGNLKMMWLCKEYFGRNLYLDYLANFNFPSCSEQRPSNFRVFFWTIASFTSNWNVPVDKLWHAR